MKTSFLLALSYYFLSHSLYAQEIKIVCDIEAGTMKTYAGNKEVFNPRIKKGQVLSLVIADYNNYIYDVEITESVERTANSDEGFFKGFEALNLGTLLNLTDTDADGVVDFLDKELETPAGIAISTEKSEVIALMQEAKSIVSDLETLDYRLSETQNQAENLSLDRNIRELAIPEFQKLKYNPNLPVSRIKEMGSSIFERAMRVDSETDLSYNDILEKYEERNEFSKMHKTVLKQHVTYTQTINELSEVNQNLQEKASVISKSDQVFFKMKLALSASEAMQAKYDQVENQLLALDAEAKNDKLDDLVQLWLERETLKSNSFSKKHTTRADGDAMSFDIKFIMKETVEATGAKREFALPAVRVPVHGGMKINTSLGIVFGQYFTPVGTYYLRDDIIEEEQGDAFLPIITSFMHFYKQGKGNASLGGSIGIGIAAGGGSTNFQSLSFFVGPSLMLGGSERIVLSAGLMGGRPERLANSYQVGDVFDFPLEVLPLRRVYELGYYLGISYNLKK